MGCMALDYIEFGVELSHDVSIRIIKIIHIMAVEELRSAMSGWSFYHSTNGLYLMGILTIYQ